MTAAAVDAVGPPAEVFALELFDEEEAAVAFGLAAEEVAVVRAGVDSL